MANCFSVRISSSRGRKQQSRSLFLFDTEEPAVPHVEKIIGTVLDDGREVSYGAVRITLDDMTMQTFLVRGNQSVAETVAALCDLMNANSTLSERQRQLWGAV